MKDHIQDPVIVKYFEELASAKLMTPEETKAKFDLMQSLNKELVISLHPSKAFWKVLYKQWLRLQGLSKVSSKLSTEHSGTKTGNKSLSDAIDDLLKDLPNQHYQPQFCSTVKLLSLNIRQPVYMQLYEYLLKSQNFTPEEVELFTRLKSTREEIVKNNLRLVVTFVKPYRDKGINFADLIQEGNLGLMRAIDKYRTDAGTQFSTYARWWVRQACVRVIKAQSRIHIPAHMQDRLLRMKLKGGYEENGENELDSETFERLLGLSSIPISLDSKPPVRDFNGNDDEGLSGLLFDEEKKLPDEELEQKKLVFAIDQELSKLDPVSRNVVILRRGLHENHAHTFQEISQKLGITREWARQLDANAIKKMVSEDLRKFNDD